MIHLVIGILITSVFFLLRQYVHKYQMQIKTWEWFITILGFLYSVFVLEIIVSFWEEGAVRGALVVGLLMSFVAVAWGVLLGRFVFRKRKVNE